jgi:hypothetical protein
LGSGCHQWWGEVAEKGVRGWICCKKWIPMYVNVKTISVETFLRSRGWGMQERSGGGRIQVWYSWYIARTFVNVTMYPHLAQHNNKWLPRLGM